MTRQQLIITYLLFRPRLAAYCDARVELRFLKASIKKIEQRSSLSTDAHSIIRVAVNYETKNKLSPEFSTHATCFKS